MEHFCDLKILMQDDEVDLTASRGGLEGGSKAAIGELLLAICATASLDWYA